MFGAFAAVSSQLGNNPSSWRFHQEIVAVTREPHPGYGDFRCDAASALLVDPLGFDAGDSNLYRYVNNAPTDATDPSGRQEAIQVQRGEGDGVGLKSSGSIASLDAIAKDSPYSKLAKLARERIEQAQSPDLRKDWGINIAAQDDAGFNISRSPLGRSPGSKRPDLPAGTLTFVSYLFFADWLISGPTDNVGLRVTVKKQLRLDDGEWKKFPTEILTPKMGDAWSIAKLKKADGAFTSLLVYVDFPTAVAWTNPVPKALDPNNKGFGPTYTELSEVQVIEVFNKRTGKVYDKRAIVLNLSTREPSIIFLGPGHELVPQLEKR